MTSIFLSMDEHQSKETSPDDTDLPGLDATEPAAPPESAESRGGSRAPDASPSAVVDLASELARVLDEEREKYLRLAAEFDNYRKRSARERQDAGWRAQGEIVAGLIDALDDIMRFAHLDPGAVDSATVVQGVAMVEKKMLKTLGGHGLEVLNPIDQLFDPAFHEAVGTEPALSAEDDHLIARVYQPGYVFRGQLVRPARVVVKQWL